MSALLRPRGSRPLWIEYGFSISPQSPPCPIVSALKPHIRAICHNSCNIVFFLTVAYSHSFLSHTWPTSFTYIARLDRIGTWASQPRPRLRAP